MSVFLFKKQYHLFNLTFSRNLVHISSTYELLLVQYKTLIHCIFHKFAINDQHQGTQDFLQTTKKNEQFHSVHSTKATQVSPGSQRLHACACVVWCVCVHAWYGVCACMCGVVCVRACVVWCVCVHAWCGVCMHGV